MSDLFEAISLEAEFQLTQADYYGFHFQTRFQWHQVNKHGVPFSQARLNPLDGFDCRGYGRNGAFGWWKV